MVIYTNPTHKFGILKLLSTIIASMHCIELSPEKTKQEKYLLGIQTIGKGRKSTHVWMA